MNDRDVVVRDGNGSSNVAMFGIIAVIVIAAIVLFLWHPWNPAGSTVNKTTINNPAPNDNSGNTGNSGTTTNTNGK